MKRIALVAALMLACLNVQADPSTLPAAPVEHDKIAVLVTTQDGVQMGVDMTSARYDKDHNILEFLEVIIDTKQKVIMSSQMAFDCWGHKYKNPLFTVVSMETTKIVKQEKFPNEWLPIKSETWLDTEWKMVCPRVKDPRATEL